MNRELVKDLILSLVIILSQLLIFNHINLFETVIPLYMFLYSYFIKQHMIKHI